MGIYKDTISSILPYILIAGAGYLAYRQFFKADKYEKQEDDFNKMVELSPITYAIQNAPPGSYEISGSWTSYLPSGEMNPPPGYPGHMTDAEIISAVLDEDYSTGFTLADKYIDLWR